MSQKSLSEVNSTVQTDVKGGFWKRLFAFLGPAYLVSVGYMDPGNWATDLAGGSRYGYALLWVLLMSNLIALLFQSMCARLGVVAQRDLAQASRELYHPATNIFNHLLAEIAIAELQSVFSTHSSCLCLCNLESENWKLLFWDWCS